MMAARNGHETITEFLLQKGSNPNFINDDGMSALILASQNGQQVIVQQLKAKGAYMIDSYIFGFADLFPSFISDPVQDCEDFTVTIMLKISKENELNRKPNQSTHQ